MSGLLDRTFLAALALALVAALALAACSDDATSGSSSTTTPTSTTSTSTTTSTAAPVPGETSALDGTAWLLSDGSEAPVVLTFGATSIDAHDGVNTLAGEYELDGSELTIRMGTPTDFPYPDDLPGAGVIERLATVERATVEGDQLTLVQRDGTRVPLEPAEP